LFFLRHAYRLPTLGQVSVENKEDVTKLITLDKIEEMPSPRIIKSHLPFYLLPPRLVDTCKVDAFDRKILLSS